MKRHKHKFLYAGIQHLHWERGYPETLVLYRCSCKRTHTEKIQGIWTAKQLGFEAA